jgi:hypothetical protein
MSSNDDASKGTADEQQHAIAGSDDEGELSKLNRASRQTQNHTGADVESMGGIRDELDGEYTIEVQVPTPARPWDYVKFAGDTTISRVVEELQLPGNKLGYRVAFEDGREAEVSKLCLYWRLWRLYVATNYLEHPWILLRSSLSSFHVGCITPISQLEHKFLGSILQQTPTSHGLYLCTL